jgi:hypothetical protein
VIHHPEGAARGGRRGAQDAAMTEVLHAETDADLLAMVPRLSGYTARESLVCLAFSGTRAARAFRLALPSRQHSADRRELAASVIATCRALRGVGAVALVVYTDRTFDAEHGIPLDDLAEEVARRVHRSGLHILGCFCVAADGWGDYLAPRSREARPLSDIATSPMADPGIPSIEGLEALETADPELARAVALALDELDELGDDLPDPCTWMESRGDARRADAAELAELVALAQWPDGCPSLLLHAAFGPDVPHEVDADELSRMFCGGGVRRPDADRVRAAIALVGRAAVHAPAELRPPLLCMLAWLSWSLGLSSVAMRRLDEAVALDPSFGPAASIRVLTEVLPEWTFASDVE